MNYSKEKINQEIASYKRKRKIFLTIGIVCFVISFALIIPGLILLGPGEELSGMGYLYAALVMIGMTLGDGSIVLIIFGLVVFPNKIQRREQLLNGYDSTCSKQNHAFVKTVDVKPVDEPKEKSKYEQLYAQYENLYKSGLISKEDLDAKRKELLDK